MPATPQTPISRDAFARLLSSPQITAGCFLPVERAMWVGDTYTLGKNARTLPKGQFTGVRLQAADARSVDQSRERAVQTDLCGLVRSLAALRKNPSLSGVVLSDEIVCKADPAGVQRALFGLTCPPGGAFTDDASAAAHCHERILRAIQRAGLNASATTPFEPTRGLAGLETWASRVRLQPAFYVPYLKWAKLAAALAAVGLMLWLVPAIGTAAFRAARSAYDSATAACSQFWAYIFPDLDQPSWVEASDGDYLDKVRVTWNEVAGATGYELFRDGGETPLAKVTMSDPREFDDTTVAPGKHHSYSVRAITLFVTGSTSTGDPGVRNCLPPQDVTASQGRHTDRIAVSWQPAEGASGYVVSRDNSSIGTTTATSGSDRDALAGREYGYTVQTMTDPNPVTGAPVLSKPSAPVATGYRAVTPPSGLSASDGTNATGVDVTWKPSEGAQSYELVRTGTSSEEKTFRAASNNFIDRDAEPGERYTYAARAITARGPTTVGNKDDGWRGYEKTAVKASDGAYTDRVVVTWNAVPYATGYRILRDGKPLPEAVPNSGNNKPVQFADRTAEAGVKHFYRVQPMTPRQDAPASDADDGWRSTPPPDGTQATAGDFIDKVVIEWKPVAGAIGYQISRDDRILTTVRDGNATTHEDTTAEIGRLYKYSISTLSHAGPGPVGKPSAGYRNLDPPQAVAATAGTVPGKVRITWRPVVGASGYQIFRVGRKAAIGFTFAHDDTSFDDEKAGPDEKITYVVKAKTDTVTGPASEASNEGYPGPLDTAAGP